MIINYLVWWRTVAAREMRLARLLVFSALAARAGAEAAADWFPRWASGGSDDGPQIQARGYQTVRTSGPAGSSGAAAAAVLEIVKENRRKRGDATPVTVLFPNKTILEMPPDGDQVDTLPDRVLLTMELMQHPVMAADGNTYDRSSIEDWFSRGKKTSPLTGAPLAHLGLTPNNLVRSMVSEYRDASSRA